VHLWIAWLIAAVALGVAELVTTSLAFGFIAVGAAAAAVTAAAGVGAVVQVIVFIAVSLASIALVRPLALRRLNRRPTLRTGAAALVGRIGYALEDVTPQAGRVRVDGQEWSARPYDEVSVIPAGSQVDVLQIKGATALVHPRE
jgi:membrane protein implicated in regulation of membrane protease activity